MGSPKATQEWAAAQRPGRAGSLRSPGDACSAGGSGVVLVGWTSTFDHQDPTLSLPRQLRVCRRACRKTTSDRAGRAKPLSQMHRVPGHHFETVV